MTIGGFNIKPKQLLIVGGILALLIGVSAAGKAKEAREWQAHLDEVEASRAAEEAARANRPVEEKLSWHDQRQADLRAVYGEPPEGFEWDNNGNPVALSDDNASCEDVVYMFLRSLPMGDFSTAGRYSNDSVIIEYLQSSHSEATKGRTSYYRNFLNKQFAVAVSTLEVEQISRVMVFPDGTQYVTVDVKSLDLSSKDFIDEHKEELFQSMREYSEIERDNSKMSNFVYDWLYEQYNTGVVGKRSYTVELVVEKKNQGGWLVSNDRELCAILQYENGLNTADYIQKEYDVWLKQEQAKERRQGK